MPRTFEDILKHADELAARFEEFEPTDFRDATALRELRHLVISRAAVEQDIVEAVSVARSDDHSWETIGIMLGTSGEAARQRYGPAIESSG